METRLQGLAVPIYLQRILPPSSTIHRENFIQLNLEKFIILLQIQLDPLHPQFNNNLTIFLELMEKIRLAVQPNLGLSKLEREAHETYQPIWIKSGLSEFDVDQILYASSPKITQRVKIFKNNTPAIGLSILYRTKFRQFLLHIDASGKVSSFLTLNWPAIYDNLSPVNTEKQQELRSFTPWQRYTEANFFNARSTNRVLNYLSNTFPDIFIHDSKNYYQDNISSIINVTPQQVRGDSDTIATDNANLSILLDTSFFNIPPDYNINQPILAVVKRHSPLMGALIQLVPASYKNNILHLILHGHQYKTEIEAIFSCDFANQCIHSFEWQKKPPIIIHPINTQKNKPYWQHLHYLRNNPFIAHTTAAPMVRGSDAAARKYWISSINIPTVYTEMITIADIFNINHEALDEFYYSDEASTSFRRLYFSEYELNQTKQFSIQIVVPHESKNDEFFWGKNGENIARTVKMSLNVMLKMIPDTFHHKLRFSINMCCPAAAIERMNGGFGLHMKLNYIEQIIQSIKTCYPNSFIEFKTLLLSDKNRNKKLNENLNQLGVNHLIWQAKLRNEEVYQLQTVIDIAKYSSFSYSGMVAALKTEDLLNLGYHPQHSPHYSVEEVINNIKRTHHGNLPPGIEIMLGRVLLGSTWLLLGKYASDEEIILYTLLQSFLLQEFTIGAGLYGIDLMQIHMLYNLRHLTNDTLRNQLMSQIIDSTSSDKIIHLLLNNLQTYFLHDDLHENSVLKPSLIKLKNAVNNASYEQLDIYSNREKKLQTFFANQAITRNLTMYARSYNFFSPAKQENNISYSLPSSKGELYIITGPSGAGKTTIINQLINELHNLEKIIPYTTRKKRDDETPDISYHYIDNEIFKTKINQNNFLEILTFNNHQYGIELSIEEYLEKINAGIDLIIDLHPSLIADIKTKIPTCYVILIKPPTICDLKNRLLKRGDSTGTIEKRMQQADKMMENKIIYDASIINHNNKPHLAAETIKSIMRLNKNILQYKPKI